MPVLAVVLLASAVALLLQPPFAFYSPDVSYHTARIVRSGEGDWFRDPFAGTLAIYPGLFHALWGGVQRVTGVDTIQIAKAAGVLNVVATSLAFFFLALQVLRDRTRAALATMALGLVLMAPTGRYVLLLNPVNFTLAPLFVACALFWRFLESGRLRDWTVGLALASFCVNVNWYQVLCVAGVLAPLAVRLGRAKRLTARVVLAGALAFAIPCLWTALHFWSIRSVLPAYRTVGTDLIPWSVELSVLRDCVVTYVTHWNLKFLPQAARSTPATVLWYARHPPRDGGAAGAARGGARATAPPRGDPGRRLARPAGGRRRLRRVARDDADARPRTRRLDPVRQLRVRRALRGGGAPGRARAARARSPPPLLSAAGVACLAYTVLHSTGEADDPLSGSTRAVVDFIAAQPGHHDMFVFTTEQSTRRLAPFVSFRTFVNHRSGLYASQDPVSAGEMFAAYQSILAHDANAQASLDRYDVRFLAFRHRDVPRDAELAAAYAGETEVALRNREWVVLGRDGPRPRRTWAGCRDRSDLGWPALKRRRSTEDVPAPDQGREKKWGLVAPSSSSLTPEPSRADPRGPASASQPRPISSACRIASCSGSLIGMQRERRLARGGRCARRARASGRRRRRSAPATAARAGSAPAC